MDGVLIVDKPAGPTSHDVVARVRRTLRIRRIGHTGTLDPLATGVLPLVVGRATRLASMLSGDEKEYVAGVRLGLATETYDAAGRNGPLPDAPGGIDRERIDAALAEFRGTFEQTPPAFSAKKIGGVAAYKLARQRAPVQPKPVRVTVTHLALESYDAGLARLRVRASAGFYVRSLAHDLGQRLGCGAHLESLRRTRAGAFDGDAAVPLETIEAAGVDAARYIVPVHDLLPHIPAVVLNDRGVRRATHGNDVAPEDMRQAGDVSRHDPDRGAIPPRWRLFDESGELLGIAESRPGGLLHPVIVLV